ncbi:hypothetical protein H074_36104 [Amycolatopsis decaplanina DSM 44594]|uniref:Uncharacterized protein n=1 Tax=Amycolatopsis decaplanina DSM 44594 TaxID=1284240 RepID=M2Y9Z7_9PSEU|nr:hypothetical protein H074_36104 [Amycolatopsis decaplanina DSM 44594]
MSPAEPRKPRSGHSAHECYAFEHHGDDELQPGDHPGDRHHEQEDLTGVSLGDPANDFREGRHVIR